MKSRLLAIPAIVAATAAFVIPGSAFAEPRDAQVQAAALLSRPHAPETLQTSAREYGRSSSAAVDAHASAAALLSGRSTGGSRAASVAIATPIVAHKAVDAHAHAAALLRGSRTANGEEYRLTAAGDLGEHPAVLVARQWSTRGINPNEFIVAHPAAPRLIAASPGG
jgi:hypothetical protein